MTQALAKSNNLYFEELGRELGFERVRHYATQFGLGELAGYNIPGEQLGVYPDQPIPAAEGGVARMCSFGQGVSLTPLQLGAYVAAIANGGTLYYLQHPTTPEEIAAFQPKVKRTLDIARYVPDIEDGMAGAVEYGTARRLRANFRELPVFGKTGTCSDNGTRFGWFASYLRFAAGQPGDGVLPRRRQAHLRPPRRRADRRVLQESLGPQLLRGEEPGSPDRARGPRPSTVPSRRPASPRQRSSSRADYFPSEQRAACGRLFCCPGAAEIFWPNDGQGQLGRRRHRRHRAQARDSGNSGRAAQQALRVRHAQSSQGRRLIAGARAFASVEEAVCRPGSRRRLHRVASGAPC